MPKLLETVLAAVLSIGLGGCAVEEDPAESEETPVEQVGTAQLALVLGNEVQVAGIGNGDNNRDIVGTWIKKPTDAFGAVPGDALAGFTIERDSKVIASVSHSANWTTASPSWQSHRSDDSVDPWPAPNNRCIIYPTLNECGGSGGTWVGRGGYDRPGAVTWTGQNNRGLIVTTGGFPTEDRDVFVVTTSHNGGFDTLQSLAISLTATNNDQTGGSIEVGSLHASLAYFRERTSDAAGAVPLPVYVIWRNNTTAAWYWTKVSVAANGVITPLVSPQRVTPLDGLNARTRASIIGFRRNGAEKVAVFWGQRTSDLPATCPNTSNTTDTATWKAVELDVVANTWGCFTGNSVLPFAGCSGGKTTITQDTAWKPCVRPSDPFTGLNRAVNNLRPEIVMNAPASTLNPNADGMTKRWWYLAVNKSVSGTQRIHVYRTGGDEVAAPPYASFQVSFVSPSTDPAPDQFTVHDSYQQSIYLHQTDHPENQPRVLVSWRNTAASNGTIKMAGMLFRHNADLANINFEPFDLSTTVWSLGAPQQGFYSASFGYQRCDDFPGCPAEPINNETVPFAAAWSDGRNSMTDLHDVRNRPVKP